MRKITSSRARVLKNTIIASRDLTNYYPSNDLCTSKMVVLVLFYLDPDKRVIGKIYLSCKGQYTPDHITRIGVLRTSAKII
mmetsp:Transcript_15375/g.17694  ORF Transcript_15375/g.17694 Transcript_15375/m.17694 type:complete len:81 (+) Transcript_15375:59-301(+)